MSVAAVAVVDDDIDVEFGCAAFFLGGHRGAFGFVSFSERDTGSEADAEADADVAFEED
jgi:hypothetical protein